MDDKNISYFFLLFFYLEREKNHCVKAFELILYSRVETRTLSTDFKDSLLISI